MKKLFTYLKNVQAEMKHVVWPTRKQALIHTGLIVLLSSLTAVFIGLLDYGFTQIVSLIVAN